MKKLILLFIAGILLFSSCVATVGYRYDPYPVYYPYRYPYGYYNYYYGQPFYPYPYWRHY
jgi:hypothetical protein